MKKLLTGISLFLGVFLLTAITFGGKVNWEYRVVFLVPEERARIVAQALQDWEQLGIESKEFNDFCERFYRQGLSPGSELEAFKSFKEFELERIKKQGMPTFAEQEEFLKNLGKDGWELIGVAVHKESGLPVGYFKRKEKAKRSKQEKEESKEPITPFEYPDRPR